MKTCIRCIYSSSVWGIFGMYGNRGERCIFRRVRHSYFQDTLLGVFNYFPVLEGRMARVLLPGLVRQFLPPVRGASRPPAPLVRR